MTTLAELIAIDPSPSWGRAMPEISYGSGTWRIAFMIANPGAGASVTWHDLTGPVSQMEWSRGTSRPRGRFEAVTPTVLIHALDDTYAPWNPDTSGTFGTHVPLRAGLLMRASVFRVSGGSVDLCFHLFTAKVRRWRDQQAANGGYRFHRVDGVDLMSYLVQAPIGSQLQEGWKTRIDDLLTDADWPFGSDIYGAQTSDSTTTLLLPDRDAQDSAINEIDATLDPVGLTWRTTAAGKFLAHPLPWDTFHAGYFASTTETIVGSEWTSLIETYHPGGPTFSYIAADDEVQFITEPGGESFGIDSDLEKVANEWTITHPVDVTNLASGTTTSAYDDAVSAARYGRRAIPAASWIAENDTVMEDLVDASAYTDLAASPLSVDIRNENAFPAIAVLDHLDPCEIRHATRPGRTELTVSGPLRQIAHRIQVQGANTLWRAQIQVDIDTESTASPLNPVQNLAVNSPVPEDYAEFTWTNPSQTTTPTETQVRITNLSTQWLDLAYPGTGSAGFDWLGLSPSTYYEFEVRLVRRVNDVITAVSPSRSVAFVTAKATVPTLNPGTGGTVNIPVDEYSCDTIEWKLEQSTDGGSSWTTVDSGDDADFDEDNVLDLTAFSYVSGYLYRVCSRCEGSGDPWDCSEVFQIECDTPGALSSAPFDDESLEIFVPKICDGEIYEAVANVLGYRGPAFGQITTDSNGEYALMSDASQAGIVAYGPADATIGLTGDASYGITVSLGAVPTSGQPMALFRCGGLQIEALYESSTTWRVRAKIFIASGGNITTTSSSPLNLDTEYAILVEHDVGGESVSVKVNDTEVATGVAGTRASGLAVWAITLPADSYATSAAVWSAVLSTPFSPSDLPGLAGWWDASDATTITESGGSVSQWSDKSGNGRHFTASSSERPTTGTRTLNSLNVLDFNGSTNRMSAGDVLDLGSDEFGLFVVCKFDTTGAGAVVGKFAAGDHGRYGIWRSGGNLNAYLDPEIGGGNTLIPATADSSTSARIIGQTIQRSTAFDVALRIDGATIDTASGGPAASILNIPNPFRVGYYDSALPLPFDGYVAEIVAVRAASVTDTDRDNIESYLASKWGITLS